MYTNFFGEKHFQNQTYLIQFLVFSIQISDCHQGVVIDGLDSKFTSGLGSASTILLRAINNRKYIFALTLKFDYDTLKNINAKKNAELSKKFFGCPTISSPLTL